jgi:hypothetical protein
MRATRMQHVAAAIPPGRCPPAEDLQRRLTGSQEKAFHVHLRDLEGSHLRGA